jgi:hypothetical protein
MTQMNEESILKKSLFLTGKLVGVFAVWVALLSFVAVIATGRVVLALSGASADSAEKAPTTPADAPAHRPDHPASNPAKPNG